jgi:shikimate dehydrogenase
MIYLPLLIKKEDLAAWMAGFKSSGLGGFNATMPHKTALLAHMDEVDESARRAGAVNTAVFRDGRLFGCNTDGDGFVSALYLEQGMEAAGKTVLLLGAGGAAGPSPFSLATTPGQGGSRFRTDLASAEGIAVAAAG